MTETVFGLYLLFIQGVWHVDDYPSMEMCLRAGQIVTEHPNLRKQRGKISYMCLPTQYADDSAEYE